MVVRRRAWRMKKPCRLGMLVRMDHPARFLSLIVLSAWLAGCGTMRSSVIIEPAAGSGAYSSHTRSATPARTPIPGGSYVVLKGDTLYSIAFRKGVDFRDLAQWNGIAAPYTIWPRQRLTLSPSRSAAPTRATAAAGVPVFKPVTSAPSVSSPKPGAATPAPHEQPLASAPVDTVPVAGVPTTPAPAVAFKPKPAIAGASRAIGGVNWSWPVDGTVISRFNSNDAIPGIEIAGQSGDPVRSAAGGMVVYSGNGLVGYGELVIIKHNDSFLSAYGHNRKRLVKEGERVVAGQQIAEMGSTGATRNELEFQIRKNGNPVDPLSYLPPR